jgi:hypothetical protein
MTANGIKDFLADKLREITSIRDSLVWRPRLDRLLETPIDEGPVFTLFFDGMNQEPGLKWKELMAVLQANPFGGRVRVVATTRTHHYEERLGQLRSLVVPTREVAVGGYETSPGGEFDQILALEGLTRASLSPDLIRLAVIPRLFDLVIRFKDRLADVSHVTPQRLLWEYGRNSIGERPYSEAEWEKMLRKIAKKYRDGMNIVTTDDLQIGGEPGLSPSETYARLSDLIDGQFFPRDGDGSFRPEPLLVAHALGVALLNELSSHPLENTEAILFRLDRWLDPISGMDERAEILRATVSILIDSKVNVPKATCGVLLTAWLQTQNLDEGHRREVVGLASELVEPLLDVIERSNGRPRASARKCAIEALRRLPKEEGDHYKSILARAYGWFLEIPRDLRTGPHHNEKEEESRSKRLLDLVGVDASGPCILIGHAANFVDVDSGGPVESVPSLIEGYPLEAAIAVFEVAALHACIRNLDDEWRDFGWLCLFNPVDAGATATALRCRALQLADLSPEPGVKPTLPLRIAAMLLGLSRDPVDETLISVLQNRFGGLWSYETDYLSDPGRSFFSLERRHAAQVLSDKTLSTRAKLHRTKEMWLDPAFEPPESFVQQLRETVADFPVDDLSAHRERSGEDLDFEEYQPALARCAPDLLAELVRRKLARFAGRTPDAGHWGAIEAPQHWILANEESASAARHLRTQGLDPGSKDRWAAENSLLILELGRKSGYDQYAGFIEADVENFDPDICEILQPLSPAEIDELVRHYGSSSAKQARDLVLLLYCHASPMSDAAWDWMVSKAFSQSFEQSKLAFATLARSDAARLGTRLHDDHWSWSPTFDQETNHFGSLAVAEAGKQLPFSHMAPSLAPWLLLSIARARGGDPDEVILAGSLVTATIGLGQGEVPDLGVELSVRLDEPSRDPFPHYIGLREDHGTEGDSITSWQRALDVDARRAELLQAAKIAGQRITEAYKAGASLFVTRMDPSDFKVLLRCDQSFADTLLVGMNEVTADFRRRVLFAEGAYLALCEALLEIAPVVGARLWKKLRDIMTTRWLGAARIDELIHILFRATPSEASRSLLSELFDWRHATTDMHLFELAVGAYVNGRMEVLDDLIESDSKSDAPWRQLRAITLKGFVSGNSLPVPEAWSEGRFLREWEERKRSSARFQQREACSRHWWKEFLYAPDAAGAYAAWTLFLLTADRRTWCWSKAELELARGRVPLWEEKQRHARLNEDILKRSLRQRNDKLDDTLFRLKIGKTVLPWK